MHRDKKHSHIIMNLFKKLIKNNPVTIEFSWLLKADFLQIKIYNKNVKFDKVKITSYGKEVK